MLNLFLQSSSFVHVHSSELVWCISGGNVGFACSLQ
jgi:hypothetical protein